MTTYFDVFNIKTDMQLNNIMNNLDLSANEMFQLDDIVNDFSSLKEKREKILEMFSGTNNYNYCRKLFLKEDMEAPSQLNMNQTIELNELFELASEKFKKVNCSQQFYQMLSQKTSKNFANAFFNMLKSIPEDSTCRFDPNLTIDGKNFAETIYPFVNELKTFLNGCKSESKKEEVKENYEIGNKVQGKNNQGTYIIDSIKDGFYNLRNVYDQNRNKLYPVSKKTLDEEFKLLNEYYDADKLSKIDHQIAQLENNLKNLEQEEKNSYLNQYEKMCYDLDKIRLRKLKAKREEYLNESIEKEISFDDIKEFAEKYDLIPTNKNEKANNKTYAKFITYPKSMNFNTFKKDALKKFGNNIEVIKGTKLKNNRFIVGIWYNGIDNLNESIETQPDMFGGPDTYYKDGIEALDFDNVLDAMNKVAPEMDFVDDRDVKGKYSMIFQPKSSGLELNQKGLKKIKDYLSQRFGKENISIRLAHSQYAPEIKKLYVTFINQIDIQNKLNESLEDTLNNFKYYITSSSDKDQLNMMKDKLEILFNGSNDTELRNTISELLSMINSKLNTIKPSIDECCELRNLLEPFKTTVVNITVNDEGCLEDVEKESATNNLKALASHINDKKDCCEENNIENMQTIMSLISSLASFFQKRLCETKINPHLDEFPNINILNESINEYRKYAGIYDLNSDTISFLPKNTIHYNFINEMDVFKGKVRFGVTEYKNSVVGYICSDTREHVMKVLKKLKKKFSSLPIEYWMIEYFEDGKRIRMNIDNSGRTIYENKNDWFPSWKNIKNKILKESFNNKYNDVREELNDIKQDYLNNELDIYDAINEVDNLIGNKSEAEAIVDSWDDPTKHGLYGITDDEEIDEDTVYDHSWYEVKGQKYPRRTKNGVEINEMCSGGACCAASVGTVPSPVKPKSSKRKHKKSKVDEMALNMFKRHIIEDVNSQIDANGNHYEYRDGYFYINGDIARTKSKYKMLESLDENIELETLPGFNSEEMKLLEDIEASGSVGNEDDNNQNNNSNNNNNADNNNNQQNTNQNINQDNLGDVEQNVTQDNDLTPQQRQLKKDTEQVLDQSMNSGSDTEVSVNQGLDNNDTTNNPTPNTNNIKYKVIGKDDSDSNNIKYIIQDPNSKQTMVVDATKLRLEK